MAIPTPEPGLTISYAYVWDREAQCGQEEGRKDRPCVIALAVERQPDGETLVTVLPVTHRPARDICAKHTPAQLTVSSLQGRSVEASRRRLFALVVLGRLSRLRLDADAAPACEHPTWFRGVTLTQKALSGPHRSASRHFACGRILYPEQSANAQPRSQCLPAEFHSVGDTDVDHLGF